MMTAKRAGDLSKMTAWLDNKLEVLGTVVCYYRITMMYRLFRKRFQLPPQNLLHNKAMLLNPTTTVPHLAPNIDSHISRIDGPITMRAAIATRDRTEFTFKIATRAVKNSTTLFARFCLAVLVTMFSAGARAILGIPSSLKELFSARRAYLVGAGFLVLYQTVFGAEASFSIRAFHVSKPLPAAFAFQHGIDHSSIIQIPYPNMQHRAQ
jgi:hypothetical protein